MDEGRVGLRLSGRLFNDFARLIGLPQRAMEMKKALIAGDGARLAFDGRAAGVHGRIGIALLKIDEGKPRVHEPGPARRLRGLLQDGDGLVVLLALHIPARQIDRQPLIGRVTRERLFILLQRPGHVAIVFVAEAGQEMGVGLGAFF
jgi:hypothetical protein